MAGQQRQFNPGVSLAGAVDLEALKHQVTAEPGQAGSAPAAGGYVIDTTENTFQAMVQTSATFPILLLLWLPTDDRLFPMAKALGDAVNAMNFPHRRGLVPRGGSGVRHPGGAGPVRADQRAADAVAAGGAVGSGDAADRG